MISFHCLTSNYGNNVLYTLLTVVWIVEVMYTHTKIDFLAPTNLGNKMLHEYATKLLWRKIIFGQYFWLEKLMQDLHNFPCSWYALKSILVFDQVLGNHEH